MKSGKRIKDYQGGRPYPDRMTTDMKKISMIIQTLFVIIPTDHYDTLTTSFDTLVKKLPHNVAAKRFKFLLPVVKSIGDDFEKYKDVMANFLSRCSDDDIYCYCGALSYFINYDKALDKLAEMETNVQSGEEIEGDYLEMADMLQVGYKSYSDAKAHLYRS
jgi:hypothetical protein